jgi:DNA-binding MarR family transcriptional regulator
MSFDPLVSNAGRLRILTSLAVEERQEFVSLRRSTQLTDGNLASHARKLQGGGLIVIEKEFKQGKPVTNFTLTPEGRRALEAHARRLIAAISYRKVTIAVPAASVQPAVVAPIISAASGDSREQEPDEAWVD